VTETLLESELFGHARGAFTGATADRPGLFESAHGGTLLLDEVGELSPAMQVRLLRVLQEREVRRVGETRARRVDVRVLAATHRNLADEVAAGRFRQDLYYRLRVVEVCIPPLRARRADVLPLARAVLVRLAARFKRPVRSLSPEAADMLLRYRWPGNVRELENTIERAAVLGESTLIDLPDLPPELAYAGGEPARGRSPRRVRPGEVPAGPPSGRFDAAGEVPTGPPSGREPDDIDDGRREPGPGPGSGGEFRLQPTDLSIKLVTRRLEMALIRRALIKTRGNRSAAAKLLELSHRALLYKLREYGLK
jgi:transcriptional regulator with PAS, ATPase and Fis domain